MRLGLHERTLQARGGAVGGRPSLLAKAVSCAFAAALAISLAPFSAATSFAAEGDAAITLTHGSDANGSVTEWMLKGDADANQVVDLADAMLITEHFFGRNVVKSEENADVSGDKLIDEDDASAIERVRTGDAPLPDSDFDFRVVDVANPGYQVSRITVNGAELVLPNAVFTNVATADTVVNGVTYTVKVNYSKTTVTGLSLAANDVRFEHAPEASGATLTHGTDGLGSVTEWMLRGDANRDARVTNSDGQAIQEHEVGFAPLADPLALESADVNRDGFEDAGDASEVYRLAAGIDLLPRADFDFRVVDVPNAGYEVSGIVVNGSPLVVPAKGQSADTQANGSSYTVSVAADGTVVVTGLSLAANDVQFAHAAVMIDVPFAGPDVDGDGAPDDTTASAPVGSKIKVDPAGGTWMGSPSAQDVAVTDPMQRIADPVREGHSFQGWEKGSADGYAFILTATWAKLPADDPKAPTDDPKAPADDSTNATTPTDPSTGNGHQGGSVAKALPATGDAAAPFALAGLALSLAAGTALVLLRRRMVR